MQISGAAWSANQGRAQSKSTTLLLGVVFLYGPLVFMTSQILEWRSDVYALVSLLSCAALSTLLYLSSSKLAIARSEKLTALTLIAFGIASASACAIAQFAGTRGDAIDMWRQVVMALAPAALFFACRAVAATRAVGLGSNLGIAAVAALSAASIILEFSGLYRFEASFATGERYFGFLGDGVAWLLAFVGVVFFTERRFAIFAVIVGLLVLTQSRAAALILTTAILSLHVIGHSTARKGAAGTVLLLAFGTIMALILFMDVLQRYWERASAISWWDNDRLWTIDLSLRLFKQSPLFGSGFNSQQYFYPRETIEYLGLQGWSTPVSTAVQVLADSGSIGFLAYLCFVFAASRLCFKFITSPIVTREYLVLRGLSAWLLSYLWVNHSAAWLLPGSYLAPIVFAAVGLLAGAHTKNAQQHAMKRAGMNQTPRATAVRFSQMAK